MRQIYLSVMLYFGYNTQKDYTMTSFSDIPSLPAVLTDRLKTLGITSLTPIQSATIEPIFSGQDVVAQSKTGSGKTLAFGIPCIIRSNISERRPETLIVTPTRELAEQIATQLRSVAAYRSNLKILTLYGGVPLRAQADSIAKGAQIIIGTPGRLMDHLGKGTLELGGIKRLVLDEADRMLDMGFGDDILAISAWIPDKRQTLLFSATYPDSIEKLSAQILSDPVHIAVDTQQPTKIKEMMVVASNKSTALDGIIDSYRPASLLIFCNTKVDAIALSTYLSRAGHSVAQLHGDLDQRERQEAVIAFSNGSRKILVATDVASRGLDITGIDLVINYDLPQDRIVYTHRIGRTGRADAAGMAITICTHGQKNKCEGIMCDLKPANIQNKSGKYIMRSNCETLCINGGKRDKLRPGDIVGALSKGIGIDISAIGDITITENITYVAIINSAIDQALNGLRAERIKKKRHKGWIL